MIFAFVQFRVQLLFKLKRLRFLTPSPSCDRLVARLTLLLLNYPPFRVTLPCSAVHFSDRSQHQVHTENTLNFVTQWASICFGDRCLSDDGIRQIFVILKRECFAIVSILKPLLSIISLGKNVLVKYGTPRKTHFPPSISQMDSFSYISRENVRGIAVSGFPTPRENLLPKNP